MNIAQQLKALVLAALLLTTSSLTAQTAGGSKGARAADALLLEDIPSVFGASRFDQLSTEAPASVSVLTRDDIALHGWRTLADVLAGVRGLYVIQDGVYPTLGARAFGRPGDYNSRTLLVVDGLRINENIYDSGGLSSESMVHVDDIDRIEIIRGPASSLYGNSAFFGVINVVTVRGRAVGGARARVTMESFGTREAALAFGDRYANGLEVSANVSRRRSDGRDFYFPELDTSATSGWARSLDGEVRDHARIRLDWGRFEATGMVNIRDKDMATARYGVDFGVPGTTLADHQSVLGLTYTQPHGSRGSLRLRASYNGYDYSGTYVYSGEPTSDWSRGRWAVLEAEYASSAWDRHKVVVGAQRTHNLMQVQGYRTGRDLTFFSDERDGVSAAFVQDEYRLANRWLVNGGLRLDHYASFGASLNPRLALIFAPRPGTALKALYGRAFRAPNVYERLYEGLDVQRNPSIRPERITTYEFLAELQVNDRLKLTGAVFHNDVASLIEYVPIEGVLGQFQNTGAAEATGAEVEAEVEWKGVRGRLSHVWQRGWDLATSEDLSNAPRHLTSANLQLPLGGPVTGSVEMRSMTSRLSASGAIIPGHAVANVWASVRVPRLRGVQLSAGVYNVFDARYADPTGDDFVQSSIPQPARNVRIQLELGGR
jgi:outer membrane receptor protein involved in Fe transport